uniref:Uncharacterized protein n=1 Tax=Eptatretus burgeri TaxID=7764 RepID=A0A8C4N6P8_EPTBU
MAALYQRLSSKINTSHSFPLAAEASRLLSTSQAEDGTGTEVKGGQEMKKTQPNQSQCNKVSKHGNPARSGSMSEEYVSEVLHLLKTAFSEMILARLCHHQVPSFREVHGIMKISSLTTTR